MRQIKTTKAFDKKLSKYIKRYPDVLSKLSFVFKTMQIDIFDPLLNTHKLKGDMKNYCACTVTYSHRLCFRYDEYFIYLESVGSHDEVY